MYNTLTFFGKPFIIGISNVCEVIMGKQIAKYKEIEHDILSQIQDGKLQTGDQILTESELCSRYQVSRMTARKALDLLSSKGILVRTPGKGTFVNSVQITKTANRTRSFSNDMRSIGKVPGSILVSYQVLHGSKSRRPPKPLTSGRRSWCTASSESVPGTESRWL